MVSWFIIIIITYQGILKSTRVFLELLGGERGGEGRRLAEGKKKARTRPGLILAFIAHRNKLMAKTDHSMSLLLDSLYLSLCIELAFDGTRELLIGVLGVAFLGGHLLAVREA
jgi:hypothetical protein